MRSEVLKEILERKLAEYAANPTTHAEEAVELAKQIRVFEDSVNNNPDALVKSKDYKPRGIF